MSPSPYMASSLPDHQIAELHRLMNEEIREVAVFFLDVNGIITVWNRGAEDMKGYAASDALGEHLALLYTDEDKARGWPEHNLAKAREDGFYREETWRKRKDGSLFWARIALTALRDHSGTLVGFSKVTVDLTDHKLLESCKLERDQTHRVLHAAHAGVWSWDPVDQTIELDSSLTRIMGWGTENRCVAFGQWLQQIHEHNRESVTAWISEGQHNDCRARLPLEYPMRVLGGEYRWFRAHADWYREPVRGRRLLSGVQVDIDDLKMLSEQRQQLVEKLREDDRQKDEFLAMLAHELRNPLAPIRAAADLLRLAPPDDARIKKTSDVIARQVGHITSLVDDLLDVSRVTRGLTRLESATLDFNQIVESAAEQIHPLIEAHRHHFELQLSPIPAIIQGDEKRLVQVISNLLNNAAKYTPDRGILWLSTEVTDNIVRLVMKDNGIGMSPSLVARVFDLFAQAERAPDRSTGGLGIGLALAKSLVDLHGGSLTAHSEGPGLGSTFVVSLPVFRGGIVSPLAKTDAELKRQDESLRILVVDDNADAAQMQAMFLQAIGHEVRVEYGSSSALTQVEQWHPHVCLLDIGLPGMDGFELAERVRQTEQGRKIVLIALTGYGDPNSRAKSLASGFDLHLVKPTEPRLLAERIEERWRSKRGTTAFH